MSSSSHTESGIDSVVTYNLGGVTVIVRVNTQLPHRQVACLIDGASANVRRHGTTLRIIGDKANPPLINPMEDPSSQSDTEITYPHGLRITREAHGDDDQIAFRPKDAENGTITIEVPSRHTLVTVDSHHMSW